ncbi:hypothetical protein, partial [Vibrio anguillarum]|uniref:hypothetical protein n=1 Tax=Vibrio anguillarum TaxID=55601 RepID=UPI001BE40B60
SAAPTPTRFDSVLSDSSIFLVAFRGVFSLTLSGCSALLCSALRCAVCKSFLEKEQSTEVVLTRSFC